MLSVSLAPDSIATAAALLNQSHFSQAQQELIESTITTIAQARHWNRDRAALWLHNQAF